jgi:hypothetical protein
MARYWSVRLEFEKMMRETPPELPGLTSDEAEGDVERLRSAAPSLAPSRATEDPRPDDVRAGAGGIGAPGALRVASPRRLR